MVQLLINHPRKVLVSYHVSLLAKPSNIYFGAKISVSNYISDSKLGDLQFKDVEGLGDIFGSFDCHRFSINLISRADDNHPAWFEYENSALGLSLPHNNSRESLLIESRSLHLLRYQLEINILLNLHLGKGNHVLNYGGVLHDEPINVYLY